MNNSETFFDAMRSAAKEDKIFEFEHKTYPFGIYVTKINGQTEIPPENIYWMLYVLPDMDTQPSREFLSQVGVSSLLVEEGKHFIFWLQTFIFSQ